jgi:hypothetical protein
MTGSRYYTQLFSVEMKSGKHFCLDCPRTIILLISASQVARIIGVSHWCLAWNVFFLLNNYYSESLCSCTLWLFKKEEDTLGVVIQT